MSVGDHHQNCGDASGLGPAQVTPVVRKALLADFEPPHVPQTAEAFLRRLISRWPEHEAEYVECIDLTKTRRMPGDEPRVHWEERTCVLDLPRYSGTIAQIGPIETRLCLAVCTGVADGKGIMSTKAWARVRPIGKCDQNALPQVFTAYSDLATKSSEWLRGWITDASENEPHKPFWKEHICFEVHAIGTNNTTVEEMVESVGAFDASTATLFSNGFHDETLPYFTAMGAATDRLPVGSSPDYQWARSPVQVELDDRRLEMRDVLYLLRKDPTSPTWNKVFGLGYDGGGAEDLAQRSSLRMLREIGPRL